MKFKIGDIVAWNSDSTKYEILGCGNTGYTMKNLRVNKISYEQCYEIIDRNFIILNRNIKLNNHPLTKIFV